MLKESTILHLRFPFSLFLMPIYFFALSQSYTANTTNMILSYFILHLLVYPASNGFNSYYDRDEGSIGALEKPPPVTEELLFVSLMLDAAALVLSAIIGWQFTLMIFLYGLVSKAYSYDKIRLKKYPMVGWVVAVLFQGAYTYFMVFMAINNFDFIQLFNPEILFPATISSVLLGGFFPITQVYQHTEDEKRGDKTLSRVLGIQNTFLFAAMMFIIADLGFLFYFLSYFSILPFILLQIFLLPILAYYIYWFRLVLQDSEAANFHHTMTMNLVASSSLIAYFIFFVIFF